ncbi:MAG TPA: AAA family ATPase [Candidatus Paceibacterota bacterium]
MKKGISAWKSITGWLWRYFSIVDLTKTLFVPWHQDRASTFDDFGWGMKIIADILIRLIGAIVRTAIIVTGLVVVGVFIFTLPLFVLLPLPINVERLRRRRPLGRDLAFRFTPLLSRYTRDMSLVAEVPLIGKEEAYKRLEQVLAKNNQDNVILVGNPGIGRTTLLEQFAKFISWGDTLPALQYRHMFEVNLEGLAEKDLNSFLTEAALAGNVILVLDNIHAYPEILDTILPFTDKSSMQIIAVTDVAGYHSVLKKRADLLQRFEKVDLEEPTETEIITLLEAVFKSRKVDFASDVPAEIVRLSDKLIFNIPQPEKSLDIVEELLASGSKNISVKDVQDLLTTKTGVPAGGMSDKERDILLNLESKLHQEIIGQDKAVEAVAGALKRSRSGLSAGTRPMGSFLFLGPTGVGKTHTAKVLNELYYGADRVMTRFDMSEFSQSSAMDDFVKQLVVAIEENPFTLVLFDEIEKSTPEVLNLFLQILDEGHLTDSGGRQIHFNNTLIVCTSNAGSDILLQNKNISSEDLLQQLIKNRVFTPEFINRFDGTVLFTPLSLESSLAIAKLILEDFATEVKNNKKITITYDNGLIEALAKMAHSSTFGARSIRRVLQDTVVDYLADLIIKDNLQPGATVAIPVEIIN